MAAAAIIAHCSSTTTEAELASITEQPQLLVWTLKTVISLIGEFSVTSLEKESSSIDDELH